MEVNVPIGCSLARGGSLLPLLISVSWAWLLLVQRPGPALAASPLTLDTLKNMEYTFTDFDFFPNAPLRFRLHNGDFELSQAEKIALDEQITAVNAGRIPPPAV